MDVYKESIYFHGSVNGRYLFTFKYKGKVFIYMQV